MLRDLQRSDLAAVKRVLSAACSFEDAAVVAASLLYGPSANGAVAYGQVAEINNELVGVAMVVGGHLAMLAVTPAQRGKGVGGALLDAVESRTTGRRLRVLAGPDGNYLAPGVYEGDADTIAWLARRGFARSGTNINLLVDVADNPAVTFAAFDRRLRRAQAAGVHVRRANAGDLTAVCAVVSEQFSPVWAFEVARALRQSEGGVYIATRDEAVVGFAAHDGNNPGRGWFGPAGTLESCRGQGVGAALLVATLLDIAAGGHRVAEIAWIGPREFYERTVGVIGERRFAVLDKPL